MKSANEFGSKGEREREREREGHTHATSEGEPRACTHFRENKLKDVINVDTKRKHKCTQNHINYANEKNLLMGPSQMMIERSDRSFFDTVTDITPSARTGHVHRSER
jgi:hypothetical protein